MDLHNNLISHTFGENRLPLTALIPGLAVGMVGMIEGEAREIYIHPTYGFDEIPSIEGHHMLIAEVQLRAVFPNEATVLSIEPIKFEVAKVEKNVLKENYDSVHKKLGYNYGKAVWAHYSWGDYQLNEVIEGIMKAKTTKKNDCYSDSFQKKLNDLHWNIYQKRESLQPGE